MNILKLKEYNDAQVVYLYQPEGKGGFGEIVYLFSEGRASVTNPAEERSSWYSGMATHKVEEFVQKKNFPIDYIQAWY